MHRESERYSASALGHRAARLSTDLRDSEHRNRACGRIKRVCRRPARAVLRLRDPGLLPPALCARNGRRAASKHQEHRLSRRLGGCCARCGTTGCPSLCISTPQRCGEIVRTVRLRTMPSIQRASEEARKSSSYVRELPRPASTRDASVRSSRPPSAHAGRGAPPSTDVKPVESRVAPVSWPSPRESPSRRYLSRTADSMHEHWFVYRMATPRRRFLRGGLRRLSS